VDTKERLRNTGHTQVWLLGRLRDKGFRSSPSELSSILNGVIITNKASAVLEASEQILDEEEGK
jgi:hypothetical protein